MNEAATRFVLFEVGRANVGDARARPPMSELLRQWNAALARDGVVLVGSVGHTGNYIAEASKASSPAALGDLFRERFVVKVATFELADFLTWATAAQTSLCALPSAPSGRRPTAGVVMDLDPEGGVPLQPASGEKVMFAPFAVPRVRGVWKMDVLRADGRGLDRTKREGGWGSISDKMMRRQGGLWTARSMRTIRLLAKRLEGLPTVPSVL